MVTDMIDILIIAILALIAGAVIGYLYRAKKRGQTCIGCPYAKQCKKSGGSCTCGEKKE